VSNATHTPGPFVASQSENQRKNGQWGIGLHREDNGYANGCDHTDAKRPYMLLSGFCSEADAYRFAAAPELLEALIAVRQRGLPDRYTSDVELAEQIDAAIAKAKGGAA
jgi:hypothetical protein